MNKNGQDNVIDQKTKKDAKINQDSDYLDVDEHVLSKKILKSLIIKDEKQDRKWRKKRKHKTQDRKTTESVIDLSTAKILLKFLNKGILENIGGIISTGKEANVYFARAGDRLKDMMSEQQDFVVAKIYRTSALDFKRMKQYLVADPRFRRVGKKTHQIIKSWAEKEYKNYKRCMEAGILVPEVYLVSRNILLMQFIGRDDLPAPVLKYAQVENYKEICDQVYGMIKTMYQEAKLVHADLSEYNILHLDNKAWLIDVGQAVLAHHPYTLKFLNRDLTNFKHYFERQGILVPDVKEMMLDICEDRDEEELLLYL